MRPRRSRRRRTSRPGRGPSSRAGTGCTSRPAGRSPSRRRPCRRRWSTACSGAPASARPPPTARPGSASRSTEAVDSLLNTPQGALVGPEPTRDGKPLDPTGRRHRPRARVGRPHGPHAQPARRAHDVLLAPPLGELARGGLAAAAA